MRIKRSNGDHDRTKNTYPSTRVSGCRRRRLLGVVVGLLQRQRVLVRVFDGRRGRRRRDTWRRRLRSRRGLGRGRRGRPRGRDDPALRSAVAAAGDNPRRLLHCVLIVRPSALIRLVVVVVVRAGVSPVWTEGPAVPAGPHQEAVGQGRRGVKVGRVPVVPIVMAVIRLE